MILDDRHIDYLLMVHKGQIRMKKGKFLLARKYVNVDRTPVDQIVASQMHVLGATRIVARGTKLYAELTARGEKILAEEDEVWG